MVSGCPQDRTRRCPPDGGQDDGVRLGLLHDGKSGTSAVGEIIGRRSAAQAYMPAARITWRAGRSPCSIRMSPIAAASGSFAGIESKLSHDSADIPDDNSKGDVAHTVLTHERTDDHRG